MQSNILQSNDLTQLTNYIATFCQKNDIHSIDQTNIKAEETVSATTKRVSSSLGIADIRRLQKNLYLAPLQSPAKIIILYDAHTLTTEAQNALLKILEEPPINTFIFLIVKTTESLLSTILSRCTIVNLSKNKTDLTTDEVQTYLPIITTILSNSLDGQLYYAQEFGKTKEEAVFFLEKLMLTLRMQLTESMTKNTPNFPVLAYTKLMQACMQTYKIVKTTNTNPRLSLENLFLLNVTVA